MASSTSAASPYLAAGEGRLGHGAHQVIDRMDARKIQRFERNEFVLNRIVQVAVDAGTVWSLMLQMVSPK